MNMTMNEEIEIGNKIKYCKCGCVQSGNFHVNIMSELGNVWVKTCKPHNCSTPSPNTQKRN